MPYPEVAHTPWLVPCDRFFLQKSVHSSLKHIQVDAITFVSFLEDQNVGRQRAGYKSV